MEQLVLLKLGGSLITDKTRVESLRPGVLARLAKEISRPLSLKDDLRLVIGHGSGSFGHVAAAKYGTRQGVSGHEAWLGFAEVSSAAARLNGHVRESLRAEDIPAVTFQPSASAICDGGNLIHLAVEPIKRALNAGLVPIVYGDVALDRKLGGTIISTEEILSYVARKLEARCMLLAGQAEGVIDRTGEVIPLIDSANLHQFKEILGGSQGTDVTGGMLSKVQSMIGLAGQQPGIVIRIFSGLKPGALEACLLNCDQDLGTAIKA